MRAAGPGTSPAAGQDAAIVVVVGNHPKPASRTLAVASVVAAAVGDAVGLSGTTVVDLAELGPRLFDWSDTEVPVAVERVKRGRVLVVASPTYKGAYTGLLKSFLDWFSASDLARVSAVPLMVGAGPRHALAMEVHLRPVFVELGASAPTRGLYVLESELDRLDQVVGEWLVEAGPQLRASLGAGCGAPGER